jgi:hypothetical protein
MNFSDERESFERDDAFLDEMNGAIEIGDRDPVLDRAIQAVGLLDQQDLTSGRLAEEGDHVIKRRTSRPFGRLDVLELAHDAEAVVLGVGDEELALRGDRESFLLLFLRRDTHIQHSIPLMRGHASAIGFRDPRGHHVAPLDWLPGRRQRLPYASERGSRNTQSGCG